MITQIACGEITVEVVRMPIKHLHLSVYPPHGRVRIAAPSRMSLDTIRVFPITKLGWITPQQQQLQSQARETPRAYVDRESDDVWGQRYLLTVLEDAAAPSVALQHLLLRVCPGTDVTSKQAIVETWYRRQLKDAVPPLITRWKPRLGVQVQRFFVQRMKTRWGVVTTSTERSVSILI